TAQGAPLTLGDALAVARASNLDRVQQEAQADVALAALGTTRAVVLPSLTGQASLLYGNDARFALDGGLGWGSTASALLSVPLLDPGGWTGVGAARSRADAARAGADAGEQDVLAAVAAQYLAVTQAEASVSAAEALLARSDRLLALARDRTDLG